VSKLLTEAIWEAYHKMLYLYSSRCSIFLTLRMILIFLQIAMISTG